MDCQQTTTPAPNPRDIRPTTSRHIDTVSGFARSASTSATAATTCLGPTATSRGSARQRGAGLGSRAVEKPRSTAPSVTFLVMAGGDGVSGGRQLTKPPGGGDAVLPLGRGRD